METLLEKTPLPSLFTYCNVPPWVVASVDFQDEPSDLHVCRMREANWRLFELLEKEESETRRGEIFHEFISVQFALHQWEDYKKSARSSLKNSYVRYLRGWGMDSGSIEGAVLKGWVDNRFGIPPTFHNGSLRDDPEALERYNYERLKGRARTNSIDSQLDLLFEFCQDEIRRRHPGEKWLTLYRGTFDAGSYRMIDSGDRKRPIVFMNNLSSFTSDRETAWEFGSTVWEVKVPLSKIFFFSDLLPESLLKGENEYMVIGGEYRVKKLLF